MWDKNNWYLAGNQGTFMKTTDGGTFWYISYKAGRVNNNSYYNEHVFDAHFFDMNTGILVGSNSSVTKTTDGGYTFDTIPGLVYPINTWADIFFLNEQTGYIVGGDMTSRMVKTTDGGNSWSQFTTAPNANQFFDIFTLDDDLMFLTTKSQLLYRSSNSGINWTAQGLGVLYENLVCNFLNRDTGFVAGSLGTVKLTTDAGITWTSVTNGLPVNGRFSDIDFRNTNNVLETYLTGDAYYIYRSTNLGTSWDTVGIWGGEQVYGGPYQRYMNTDLGGGDTLLSVGTYGLINKRNSSSNCVLYSSISKFGGESDVYDLWLEGSKIWAVGKPSYGAGLNNQILYSDNSGLSWIVQPTGSTTDIYSGIFMINSQTGFISGTNGIILKTDNGGWNWNKLTSPTTKSLFGIKFTDQNTGWVYGSDSTLYKTTNTGSSWVQQIPQGMRGDIKDAEMINSNTGWIMGNSNNIYKTTDGGVSWSHQNGSFNGIIRDMFDIKMLDANVGYICGVKTFAKTINGGVDWDTLAMPFPSNIDFQLISMDFINALEGMIINSEVENTIRTTNGGNSWQIDNIGTSIGYTGPYFSKIKMHSDGSAYIGGVYASVLKYNSNPIGITEWQSGVPEKFELKQNYPNPFNPTTTIKFSLPKAGNVSLKIFDITGREVRIVLNNMSLNPGIIMHEFDGSMLASGVYFYSLYFENSLIDTKKMVIIK